MAGTTNENYFDPQAYLSPNQQDLLLAALSSNNPTGLASFGLTGNDAKSFQNGQFSMDNSIDPSYFTSPQQAPPSGDFGSFNMNESPFGDFVDNDGNFDFDPNEEGDLMIGSLPGENGTEGEKRKSPEDDDDEEEGEEGNKRREGDDKNPKKPGRKPLTSEPTTKRKAQNRAAQRAFRERKEKHLKDLEGKVAELEKASDATNHENGLLRAQVSRLQTELREYRKRLSQTGGISRSPPVTGGLSSLMPNNAQSANNTFQFEFPRFGGLPGSQLSSTLGKGNVKSTPPITNGAATSGTPGVLNRQQSNGRSVSPKSGAQQPTRSASQPKVAMSHGLFSNSMFNNTSLDYGFSGVTEPARSGSESNSSRVFQFNSGSTTSNTNSPSASSQSQFGANSSCGTSPEPSHSMKGNNDSNNESAIGEGFVCHGDSEGEVTFCEKLSMACGNPRNPVPRAMSQSNDKPAPAAAKTPSSINNNNVSGIDALASQNGGQFDPVLFGDYREPQSNIVGDGDFTGGFFNDALATYDLGSPFHFGDTPAVQKSNPLDVVEALQDGNEIEEVVPGEDTTQMLSCHKIWDKLQNRPDFKDGTIDIDNLCSELRAKARCSESGVVVDNKDVDAALKRLPRPQQGQAAK